ncbi:hypothetical protein ABPG74_020910 [Tetrahymena malaccensis]
MSSLDEGLKQMSQQEYRNEEQNQEGDQGDQSNQNDHNLNNNELDSLSSPPSDNYDEGGFEQDDDIKPDIKIYQNASQNNISSTQRISQTQLPQQQGGGKRNSSLLQKEHYHQKNQEMIQKLMEKKKKEQEEKEKKELKLKKREDKLRKRMLEEAAKIREQKEVNLESQTEQSDHSNATKSKKLKFKSVQDIYQLVVIQGKYQREQLTEKQQQELNDFESRLNEEKTTIIKMQQVYRSRQITFLEELKKKQEKKKQEEEQQKMKQEKIQTKLREQYENVNSNLYAETELFKQKKQEITKVNTQKQLVRATSAEGDKEKDEKKDIAKKIQQKNQEYIEKLKEKKRQEIAKEEEEKKKKEQLREKMKDFVLVNIKKDIENGVFFVDVPEKKPKKEKKKNENKEESTQITSPKLNSTKSLSSQITRKTNDVKKVEKLPKIKDSNKENHSKERNEENEEGEDGEYECDEGDEGASDGEDEDDGNGNAIKRKLRKYPFITDLELWKKKQRLPADIKVFIVTGGYHDISRALKKRGWIANPDTKSPCYNFRWSLQTKDIDYENLKDFQIVNHFQKSACITTKVGLCKSLRNLVWHENVDIDTFYPRCFDLNDPEDFENFVEEFKSSKAESILKRYMRMYFEKDQDIEKIKKQAVIAFNVCERKMKELDEIIDDPNSIQLITKKEWNILSADELTEEKLAQKKYEQWLERIEGKNKQKPKKKKKKANKEKQQGESAKKEEEEGEGEDEEEEEEEDEEDEEKQMDEFTLKVHQILKRYKVKYPQDCLTGEDNVWIIKPAGLSRGRGITCYNNLVEILDHVKSKESQWVIQKYIENPLIIKKRKFDIRVWILVTDWNPLTIWHYTDCYVRFSVDDYDTENLQNKFTHLTNNMISKLKQRDEKDDITELGSMYFKENFINYLKEKEGYDVFTDKIEPQIVRAIIMSLKSVQDNIENRKNSIEMYGYDFMIDELYNTWLIEINSSPSMEYSTPVTERLVKAVSEDIIKVVIDYGMEKSKKARKNIETGAFKRIYKGKYVEEKTNVVGLNLICEGVALKKGKKNSNVAKVTNLKPNFS